MRYGTTPYSLTCPDPLWAGLKEVQSEDRNVNDELVYAIAAHVDECSDDLDPEIQAAVEEVLEPR